MTVRGAAASRSWVVLARYRLLEKSVDACKVRGAAALRSQRVARYRLLEVQLH